MTVFLKVNIDANAFGNVVLEVLRNGRTELRRCVVGDDDTIWDKSDLVGKELGISK